MVVYARPDQRGPTAVEIDVRNQTSCVIPYYYTFTKIFVLEETTFCRNSYEMFSYKYIGQLIHVGISCSTKNLKPLIVFPANLEYNIKSV